MQGPIQNLGVCGVTKVHKNLLIGRLVLVGRDMMCGCCMKSVHMR